jgi:hypothetical protein
MNEKKERNFIDLLSTIAVSGTIATGVGLVVDTMLIKDEEFDGNARWRKLLFRTFIGFSISILVLKANERRNYKRKNTT